MHKGRFAAIVALVGLGAGASAPVVSADPAPQKDLCKNGGYRFFRDSSGNPFKNQGQCVKFVNGGGNLFGSGSPTV